MGRGASDSEATFSPGSSFLSAANVCEVDMPGQVRLWLRTGYKCRQSARRKSAAVPDMKELLLLVCIVLSYCFYGVSGSDEVLKRKAYPVNDSSSTRLIFWSVRAVGVAFAALVLILLFPSFHSWVPEDTTIPSTTVLSIVDAAGYSSVTGSSMRGSVRFQEAPSVRNGDGCPTSSIRSEDELACDPALVHIAMTLDTAYLRGSMAAVFSILQHANCPENVFFHFLVTEGDREYRALMRSTFPHLHFKIYHFEEALVKDRISSSVREALEQPLNYARSYLAELLEWCIERVIYLDSDLVVVDDIAKLWATRLGPGTVLGAPEYCHANFTKYFSPSFWEDARLASNFLGRTPCYFNTGVMVMDLAKWREGNCTKEIERWMDVQKERRIYELGSLPPFLLVFAGSVEPVEHRWNQHGLGGDSVRGSCRSLHPGPVSLLHWSGEGKPWVRLDSRQPCPLDTLWAPYDLYYASSFF